jgi:hypothetical protein
VALAGRRRLRAARSPRLATQSRRDRGVLPNRRATDRDVAAASRSRRRRPVASHLLPRAQARSLPIRTRLRPQRRERPPALPGLSTMGTRRPQRRLGGGPRPARHPRPAAARQAPGATVDDSHAGRLLAPDHGVDAVAAPNLCRGAGRDPRGHRYRSSTQPLGRDPTTDQVRWRPGVPSRRRNARRRRAGMRGTTRRPVLTASEGQDRATASHDRGGLDRASAALHRWAEEGQRSALRTGRSAVTGTTPDQGPRVHRRL